MSELSPNAQAVFNAAWTCPIVLGDHPATRSRQIAAALRATADQVAPLSTNRRQDDIRHKIRAIAAELEAFAQTDNVATPA
jgi:hypothetical protein